MSQEAFDKLRGECWDNALQCFGYSYIFSQRINKYSSYNKWLKFFALLLPSVAGLVAFGYKAEYPLVLDIAIIIAVPLTIVQFVFSLLAITQEWDNELLYSVEASNDYDYLSGEFRKIAKVPPSTFDQLDQKYELLNEKLSLRGKQDSKHQIKEKERRKGMRAALREFQRQCAGCNQVPKGMESTACDICGKF